MYYNYIHIANLNLVLTFNEIERTFPSLSFVIQGSVQELVPVKMFKGFLVNESY